MRALLRRPRGQRGFTLIELLLVVGISAVILVPVFAWAILAVRTQPVTHDGLVRVADTGLLGASLPEDVATAGAGATPGSVTIEGDVEVSLDDCIGGAGEVHLLEAVLADVRRDAASSHRQGTVVGAQGRQGDGHEPHAVGRPVRRALLGCTL